MTNKTYVITEDDKTAVIRALNSGTMKERIAAAVLLHSMPEQSLPLITQSNQPETKEKVFVITQSQIDEINFITCEYFPTSAYQTARATLQSLPEVVGEPVCWLTPYHIEPTMNEDADDGFDIVRAGSVNGFPVYTHPKPLQPITADDVTDEMVGALIAASLTGDLSDDKELMAVVYNSVIKYKGDTK